MAHRHVLGKELSLAGERWLIVDLGCWENKSTSWISKTCTLYLIQFNPPFPGLTLRSLYITSRTNWCFIWETEENKNKTDSTLELIPLSIRVVFILNHWLALMALQRNPHDLIVLWLLLCSRVLITALTSVKAPSQWCESSQVTSSVALEVVYVTHAEEPDCLSARAGNWSGIWPKARLLTNEPVEDVKHHLQTVKRLSATSK